MRKADAGTPFSLPMHAHLCPELPFVICTICGESVACQQLLVYGEIEARNIGEQSLDLSQPWLLPACSGGCLPCACPMSFLRGLECTLGLAQGTPKFRLSTSLLVDHLLHWDRAAWYLVKYKMHLG